MGKLIKLAEIFNITVDYLLTGDPTEERPLHNLRLLECFRALEQFDAADQETVTKVLDAMIMKNKIQGAMSPLDSHPEKSD